MRVHVLVTPTEEHDSGDHDVFANLDPSRSVR